MRTHGKQKRRTWRKYHVSVDPVTHEVMALELTEANVHDCTVLPALLSTQKNVGTVYADGAYSFKDGFDAIAQSGGKPSIPVRGGTTLTRNNPSPGQKLRDEVLLISKQRPKSWRILSIKWLTLACQYRKKSAWRNNQSE